MCVFGKLDINFALGKTDGGQTLDCGRLCAQKADMAQRPNARFRIVRAGWRIKTRRHFFISSGLPNLRGAALDARGNGQSIAEAMRDEFGAEVCESVMLSENWYRTHTAPFKAALEDGTLDAIPKDEDILTDLRAFELVRGVPRIPDVRTKGQDGKKRHGDAAIAFVLAHYASRELNTGPIRVASRRIRRKSALTKGY